MLTIEKDSINSFQYLIVLEKLKLLQIHFPLDVIAYCTCVVIKAEEGK